MAPEEYKRRFSRAVVELRKSLGRPPSTVQVALRLEVSRSTVIRWCQRLDMGTPAGAIRAALEA